MARSNRIASVTGTPALPAKKVGAWNSCRLCCTAERAVRPLLRGDLVPLVGFMRAIPALRVPLRAVKGVGLDRSCAVETVTPLDVAHV